MKKVILSDITIKQSMSNLGYTLSFREKIEVAKLLDLLGVDVIELHPITPKKADLLLVKSICLAVEQGVVAVPVGEDMDSIAQVWSALKEAKHPRLQVELPVSDLQMEYLAGKKPAAMLEYAKEMISGCKAFCEDVELMALDATRSDLSFLKEMISLAIQAGATTITLCDSAGKFLGREFGEFVANLKKDLPQLEQITLGICSADSSAMADAAAVEGMLAGAGEVKTSGKFGNTANLKNIVSLLASRPEVFGLTSSVDTTNLQHTLEQVEQLCQAGQEGSAGLECVAVKETSLALTKESDLAAVNQAAVALGYDLSEADQVKVFEAVKEIIQKKESLGAKELDAIVASAALQVPPTYRLEQYMVHTGNMTSATAQLKLWKDGSFLEGISMGDGPIAAAFLAIEQVVGCHFELDDFQIQSVTQGKEAMGEAVVKLRNEGKLYSGRGISVDIVGASINAYLNALNKILYEESVN